MDNSTGRVILAVALCVVIFWAAEAFFGPSRKKLQEVPRGGDSRPAETITPEKSTESARTAQREREKGDGPRVKRGDEGQLTVIDWPGVSERLTFSDRGATLRHALLLNPRFSERRGERIVPVDLVQTAAGSGLWPLRTTFIGSDFEVPEDAKFELTARSPASAGSAEPAERFLRYEWVSKKIKVVKKFVLDPVRPVLWMTVSLKNIGEKPIRHRLNLELFSRANPNVAAAGITNPYPRISSVLCRVNGEVERRSAASILGESSGCSAGGCGGGSGEVMQVGRIGWIGSDDRYFLMGVVPRKSGRDEARCSLKVLAEDDRVASASMVLAGGRLARQEETRWSFAVYLGAKDVSILDSIRTSAGENAELAESIELGFFAFISRPLLVLLKFFYKMVGNWGLAIILLTLMIKGVTVYWSTKSMRSMREMQRLKPKMDVLREKFADDKSRLNQEMMALYRLHKVSPLGGCLPMVIQMPIWFSLYSTLGNAQELYRSGFFGWIHDLTASDPYYILPLAVGAAMFGQQAITPQAMEGAQAKIMKYMMPAMFSVFMVWLPAGLTLYVLVNTVLTMLHQWYMNRGEVPEAQAVEQSLTATAGVSEKSRSVAAQNVVPRAVRRRRRKKASSSTKRPR